MLSIYLSDLYITMNAVYSEEMLLNIFYNVLCNVLNIHTYNQIIPRMQYTAADSKFLTACSQNSRIVLQLLWNDHF